MNLISPLPPRYLSILWFFLAWMVMGTALAMPGFDTNVSKLCGNYQRAAPVFHSNACFSCHTDGTGGIDNLDTKGLAYQAYLIDQNATNLESVLNAFCMGAYYNLSYDTTEKLNKGALPPVWNQAPPAFNYQGLLDVYWLARLGGDNQVLVLSRENAALQSNSLPANFNLVALPDNCWGKMMNFGLLTLDKKANLTVRVAADTAQGSTIIPGFALYKGWDSGQNSFRHQPIAFGEHNPLQTTGLTFLGEALGATAGGSVEKTFAGLEPGNYELFVTVGSNQSRSGAYTVTLTTRDEQASLVVTKFGNGTVTSVPAGIDCGPTCFASFPPGTSVTLTATPGAGYRFKEWLGCDSVNGDACTITLNGALGVVAKFEQLFHTLSVKTSGSGSVLSEAGISCGADSLNLCSLPLSSGINVTLLALGDLAGWSGACSGTKISCDIAMTQDRCVAVNFTGDSPVSCPKYPLTISTTGKGRVVSNVGGLDCGSICRKDMELGTPVSLVATPAEGYRFKEWGGACSGALACEVTMNSEQAVSAIFEGIPKVLTVGKRGEGWVASTPDGIDCGAACSFGFMPDGLIQGEVLLKATAAEGYTFDHWSGCDSIENDICHVAMSRERSVRANFIPETANNPTDGICGSANDKSSPFAPREAEALCQAGNPTYPTTLADGRFAWLCQGVGETACSAQCYTLSPNGKKNQTAINLVPGKATVRVGRVLKQTLVGGNGKGKVRVVRVSATAGTRCRIAGHGTGRRKAFKIKTGGTPGVCVLQVSKAKDARYNAVQSPPITITVAP